MRWVSEIGYRVGDGVKRTLASNPKKNNAHGFRQENPATQGDNKKTIRHGFRHEAPATLGILAFETAKTMSRLVSLYKSLSDNEVFKLRKEVMRSEGVAYLNSRDEGFLLNLACAERLEDLDHAAIAVARLGQKCSDFGLNRFDLVFAELKLGAIDLCKLDFGSKEIEKIVYKMESFISATSSLYSASEALSEMEISERKLKTWRNHSGQMQPQKANFDLFDEKIAWQRKHVRHLRDISLWSQTFDKSVGLMARIACALYARICFVFGPYISGLPRVSARNVRSASYQKQIMRVHPTNFCLLEPVKTKSGPIMKSSKPGLVRFYSGESNLFSSDDIGFGVGFGIGCDKNFGSPSEIGKNNRVIQAASASTVGGSGLALRYANVIILAERYLHAPSTIGEDAREELYRMLPAGLKMSVRSKLRKSWSKDEDEESLAEGWRDALKGILGWLSPMAQDMVKWQAERNLEKQKFDAKPTVLLLQTLHFSDKEKTEAAIAEVLVGLSCIYRCENRRSCDWVRF